MSDDADRADGPPKPAPDARPEDTGADPAQHADPGSDQMEIPDSVKQADGGASDDDFPRTLAERLERRVEIRVPVKENRRLGRILDRVNADDDLYALWTAANVTAINRLGMTDHGPVHVKIVTNIAVRLFRLLMKAGVEPGIVKDHGLDVADGEVVVALAALCHDLGMSIHRADHESYSLFVAQKKLDELLADEYTVAEAAIVRSEVLHAIIAHRSGGKPLTLEAGIVRIADALDMAKGRSRIPFEKKSAASIHSVSAAAIEQVHILEGAEKPIRLVIEMTNSAGVFQLDQLFREKLQGSGLEEYIELEAEIEGEKEKRLLRGFRL